MEIGHALNALSSLAQETRLAVFRLLVCAGPEGLAAGEIAAQLHVPLPTMSFHLAHLARSGLVHCTREGRSLVYAVDLEGVRGLLHFLMKDCCGGRPEFCGEIANQAVAKTLRRTKPRKSIKHG
jgi:DNA-binding transcriptional ArsR family regulator